MLLPLVMSAVMELAAPGGDVPPRWMDAAMHRALTAPERKVRAIGDRVTAALREGARRSPTFADLLAALDRSDVIVYVELSHDLRPNTDGRTMLVTRDAAYRYVRIQVRALMSPDVTISLIGHELQHALEIASTAWIRNDKDLRQFYERAGAGRSLPSAYETQAARDAGYQVRLELRRNA